MNINDLAIDRIGLSTRSLNALHRANVQTVGELLTYTEDSLRGLRSIGNTSVKELLAVIEKYRQMDAAEMMPESAAGYEEGDSADPVDYDTWVNSDAGKREIAAWLEEKAAKIDALKDLSPRAYNLLRLNGYQDLHRVIFLSKEDLMRLPRMDLRTASEIENSCRHYVRDNQERICGIYTKQYAEQGWGQQPVSVFDIFWIPDYHDRILDFVKANDRDLKVLGLSKRALNRLYRMSGIYSEKKLSDIIFMTRAELLQLPGMGAGTADEILGVIHDYLSANGDRILAVCMGDVSAIMDDPSIRQLILEQYHSLGFRGLSLKEMEEKLNLPEQVTEERLKKIIGTLLAEGELEYVDYRCYRNYKSFSDQLELCDTIPDRSRDIIRRRLQGETLEKIGTDLEVTRERVRQIIKKDSQKVRDWNEMHTGMAFFDEDYYRYFYETYAFEKNDAIQWFGMTVDICSYLDMMDAKRGKEDLQEAIDDHQNLDAGLRLKVKNYLNRNKLFIDGMWVEKRRKDLEEAVVRKFCRDSVSFEEFVRIYNQFLEEEEVVYDENIYCTEAVYRTRKNHLSDERYILWKQNEQLRYYDIDGRDFSELLDKLNLDAYENTELSTAKFVEDYPEILEKYDIRDQYELHNLLRKIIPEGSYHDFHCGRMPMIRFGEFDRDAAILDILIDHAPVSTQELCSILHAEYGYDPAVAMGSYLRSFDDYYFKGMYIVDQKAMTAERKEGLARELTDDFYYIDEIRRKYTSLFPEADPGEVNPYNLKTMGFSVYSRYALQHYDTLETYFEDILTREDIIDISPYRKRYAYVQLFSQKLMELKRDLQIVEFEPNQIIHFRRLEESGISREMVWDFCDKVYEFIEDGAYFSAAFLRQAGFETELYDLGFSDWFYASLLIADPRFSFGMMYGNIILLKGRENITIKSFETYLIRKYDSIDVYDLMSEMTDLYGCRITDRLDVIYKVRGTEIYYDAILDRLYANIGIYDREVERAEGI